MTKRQIFIDTETTGLSARSGHRIIELAAVEAIDGCLTGKVLHTYLDPGRDIDPGAQRVHGITAASLVGKPKFIDIVDRFVTFVEGANCLMHNATFDRGFIDAELARAGQGRRLSDLGEITCTLKIARQRFPGHSASLDALISRAGLSIRRQKHSAVEDATLLATVYFKVLTPAVYSI